MLKRIFHENYLKINNYNTFIIYKMMFNFGSGAEFDRTREIDKISEEQINYRNPSDYYGLAKNLIFGNLEY